jgi:uncharacterized protein (TIGR00369 family)
LASCAQFWREPAWHHKPERMNLFKDTDRRLSGLEQLRPLLGAASWPEIGNVLHFALTDLEAGRAVFEAVPRADAYNPLGVVHGGFAAALLDSACGTAVHSSLAADQAYTTLELKVQYHRAITLATGRVRAEGTLLTLGRRVAFAEGRLVDTEGRLHASATSTLLVFAR